MTAEYRRLLYVAMTRAPATNSMFAGYRGPREPSETCWYNTVSAALKPRMTPLGEEEGWRLGPAPVMGAAAVADHAPAVFIWPDWIARDVAQGFPRPRPCRNPGKRAAARVERGILIHRILENLPEQGRG